MKRRNQIRHSPQTIKQALTQLQGGKSLSEVAENLGIAKSLLKYWKDRNIQLSPNPHSSTVSVKMNQRTHKFMDRCWSSMSLAFKQLHKELKKDTPRAAKDLTIAISVLYDKLVQASQSLQNQSTSSSSQAWEASEETLMILQRHREAKTPESIPVEAQEMNLGAPDLEPQKKETEDGLSSEEKGPLS